MVEQLASPGANSMALKSTNVFHGFNNSQVEAKQGQQAVNKNHVHNMTGRSFGFDGKF